MTLDPISQNSAGPATPGGTIAKLCVRAFGSAVASRLEAGANFAKLGGRVFGSVIASKVFAAD